MSTNPDIAARLAASHLHRSLRLPTSSKYGALRITFGTTSNFSNVELPVVLFCAPIISSRWDVLMIDNLATQCGVRVICIDRPGRGGSEPVPPSQRIPCWIETVPIVLRHLGVSTVSLVSHSAGTLYCLHTIYYLREILDPKTPYVAFLGPWTPPERSTLKLVKLLNVLPEGMIRSFDGFTRFMVGRVVPSVQFSADLVSPVVKAFKREDSDEFTAAKRYGTTVEEAQLIDKTMQQYTMAEDRSGINDEALLMLKRTDAGAWGICDDYEKYMIALAEKEAARRSDEGHGKLSVDVFYAEDDMMIGKTGQAYFESCWTKAEGIVDVRHQVLPGTSHETIITDFDKGALKLVFDRIARGSSGVQD